MTETGWLACHARALLEYWWRGLFLLRQPDLRRLAVIPLEGEVRRSHSESARGDLLEVLVTRLDPELHGVERILEADGDTHVVTVDFLADGDRGHLHRRKFALLDFHRSAIEVVGLENYRG